VILGRIAVEKGKGRCERCGADCVLRANSPSQRYYSELCGRDDQKGSAKRAIARTRAKRAPAAPATKRIRRPRIGISGRDLMTHLMTVPW
jgi:hypothetical protein